jgi:hypothetical protein
MIRRTHLAVLASTWVACQGALLRIDVEESTSTVIGRGTPLEVLVSDIGFDDLVALDLTTATELENQGVAPGDIVDARFTSFTLSAVAPAGADLSFLDDLSFWVEAPDLPRVRIAAQDTFGDAASVDLALDDVDLTPYLVSQAMTITTEATGRRPSVDTEVEASFVLNVGVTAQGACNYLNGE